MFKNKCFEIKIYTITVFLQIKDIDAVTHETNKYVQILIFISKIIKNGNQILICIIREIYLINKLKISLLIENDFLESEEFTINVNNKKVFIASCDVNINLSIKQRKLYVQKHIHVIESIIILLKAKIKISIKFSVFINRDFMFELINKTNFTLFY